MTTGRINQVSIHSCFVRKRHSMWISNVCRNSTKYQNSQLGCLDLNTVFADDPCCNSPVRGSKPVNTGGEAARHCTSFTTYARSIAEIRCAKRTNTSSQKLFRSKSIKLSFWSNPPVVQPDIWADAYQTVSTSHVDPRAAPELLIAESESNSTFAFLKPPLFTPAQKSVGLTSVPWTYNHAHYMVCGAKPYLQRICCVCKNSAIQHDHQWLRCCVPPRAKMATVNTHSTIFRIFKAS